MGKVAFSVMGAITVASAALMFGLPSLARAEAIRPSAVAPVGPETPGWRIVFSEDFNGDHLDPAKWNVEHTSPENPGGIDVVDFSNAPEYVRVENGKLQIRSTPSAEGRFLSGLIETRGKHSWMYGRFEARIKVARGAGTNTAFWMMPDVKKFEPWPKSGEIDITEQLGREPTITHGTIHYPGHLRRRDQGVYNGDVDLADDFHVYGVEWSRGAFEWYVDGKIFHRTSAPDMARFPFNRRFFLILSQQPGGKHWGGPIDKDTPNPMLMEVDWVRVLKRVPK